jgi:hypothetical protein
VQERTGDGDHIHSIGKKLPRAMGIRTNGRAERRRSKAGRGDERRPRAQTNGGGPARRQTTAGLLRLAMQTNSARPAPTRDAGGPAAAGLLRCPVAIVAGDRSGPARITEETTPGENDTNFYVFHWLSNNIGYLYDKIKFIDPNISFMKFYFLKQCILNLI